MNISRNTIGVLGKSKTNLMIIEKQLRGKRVIYSGARVLLIEDSDDIRNLLKSLLEFEGYEVSTAANGLEGLQAIAGGPLPSLILLDLMMPVMDGPTFLDRIQSNTNSAESKIPIVVTTASSDQIAQSIAPRVQEVIKKPLDISRLLGTVGRYLSPAATQP